MSEKFKILYLSPHSEVGGGESSLFYFLKYINRKRFHPVVLIKKEGTFSRLLKKEGIEVEIKDIFFTWSKKWWRYPKRIQKVAIFLKIIKKLNPHLIHPNTFEAFLNASPVSSLLKIPIIATIRGFWEINSIYELSYAEKKASIFHLTSPYMLRLFNFPLEKTYIADFGVDIQKYSRGNGLKIRKEINLQSGTILIGIIGRFSPEKGQHIFVEAFDILTKSNSSINVHVLFVGSSKFSMDKGYKNKVEKEVKRRGLDKYFSFLGFREDIPDILHALDILVIPSVYEMSSRIAQEASAAGIPIISTNFGGIKDIVINGVTGLHFKSGDPNDLKEKLQILLIDKKMRKKLAVNAKKIAERFDAKKLAKEIESMYEKIISKEI